MYIYSKSQWNLLLKISQLKRYWPLPPLAPVKSADVCKALDNRQLFLDQQNTDDQPFHLVELFLF